MFSSVTLHLSPYESCCSRGLTSSSYQSRLLLGSMWLLHLLHCLLVSVILAGVPFCLLTYFHKVEIQNVTRTGWCYAVNSQYQKSKTQQPNHPVPWFQTFRRSQLLAAMDLICQGKGNTFFEINKSSNCLLRNLQVVTLWFWFLGS